MIPNISHGNSMRGLIGYLAGKGVANEHTNPHVVGGSDYMMIYHSGHEISSAEVSMISDSLDLHREMLRMEGKNADAWLKVKSRDQMTGKVTRESKCLNVWHCSLAIREGDVVPTEEQWGSLTTDFMERMGFVDPDNPARSVEWVAIDHGVSANGNHHVHIAASRVRPTGEVVFLGTRSVPEFAFAQKTCRDLEHKYGLEVLASAEAGMGQRGYTKAEQIVAEENGLEDTTARILESKVRAAAVESDSEGEFIRSLRSDGVVVKPRFERGRRDVVIGYRVALKPERTGGEFVFFGGGRLAKDLALPKLREGWSVPSVESAQDAVDEWRAAYGHGESIAHPERHGATGEFDAGQFVRDLKNREPAATWSMKNTGFTADAEWQRLSHEVAGAWNALAEYDPELAEAARQIAREAQKAANQNSYIGSAHARTRGIGSMGFVAEVLRRGQRGKVPKSMLLIEEMTQHLTQATVALMRWQEVKGVRRDVAELNRAWAVVDQAMKSSEWTPNVVMNDAVSQKDQMIGLSDLSDVSQDEQDVSVVDESSSSSISDQQLWEGQSVQQAAVMQPHGMER